MTLDHLPAGLQRSLEETLRSLGDPSAIQSARGVGGGCIHQTMCLDTLANRYLLKWNPSPAAAMYRAEAQGLAALYAVGAVRTPQVLACVEPPDAPAYLLLEWIEPAGQAWDAARLGEELAELHRLGTAAAYGFDADNFIGSTPQSNRWQPDWVTFFREERLRPQMMLAARNGLLPSDRRRRLERLMDRLDALLGNVKRRPALLHGDLWAGNVIGAANGQPVLIDPAVYYGDREAELAFTRLFGGFSLRFYQAYQSTVPLPADAAERVDLYNLYHLFNHLNLFGEMYAGEVDRALRRYTD